MANASEESPNNASAGSALPAIPVDAWNERYGKPGFAYGTEPNEFLVSALRAHGAGAGAALFLAEGEGRNAVHAAALGYATLAIDQSPAGLAKVAELATMKGVRVETLCLDLNDYAFPPGAFSLVASIFGHLPPQLRRKVHRGVAAALAPSGLYIMEAYHPRNVGRGTGGPQEPLLCVAADNLREELAGLEFVHLLETEREVNEGAYHRGLAAVTQLVARKPA